MHRKSVSQTGGWYAEHEEVWTWKSVKLWQEHMDLTASGCPVSKALNISVAILNLMRHSTGSQWSCFRR